MAAGLQIVAEGSRLGEAWVKLNVGQLAPLRVQYPPLLWDRLASAAAADHVQLPEVRHPRNAPGINQSRLCQAVRQHLLVSRVQLLKARYLLKQITGTGIHATPPDNLKSVS